MDLDFTDEEVARYSRNILLSEVGGTGQAALRAARVLVVCGVPWLWSLRAGSFGWRDETGAGGGEPVASGRLS